MSNYFVAKVLSSQKDEQYFSNYFNERHQKLQFIFLLKSPIHTGDREYHYTKDNGNDGKFVKDGERPIVDVGKNYDNN